jgi:hypothetical protein
MLQTANDSTVVVENMMAQTGSNTPDVHGKTIIIENVLRIIEALEPFADAIIDANNIVSIVIGKTGEEIIEYCTLLPENLVDWCKSG